MGNTAFLAFQISYLVKGHRIMKNDAKKRPTLLDSLIVYEKFTVHDLSYVDKERHQLQEVNLSTSPFLR